jgi:hypothetical protein
MLSTSEREAAISPAPPAKPRLLMQRHGAGPAILAAITAGPESS